MRIDGKSLANSILSNLAQKVSEFKKLGVTPTLAGIQVGDDQSSVR